MNFRSLQIYQLKSTAHGAVASAAIALFGIASSAQAAMLAPNFSDGMSTFTEPFEFIAVQGMGNPDFKEFRYIITENSKVPSATPTCTTGTAIQPDSSGLGRLMFPPVIPPRTSRNMVTATISVIACGNTAGNESPVAWVWFEYNGPTVAQAGELAAPTLSEVSGSFNATFNLSVTQGAGSDTGEFKEFRYTKTSTTTPPAAPANCTLGTAVPSNGIISIAATTSISVIACGKTTGNKSSATTATYTLDKAPPTLVVTGPFGSDGTTALLLANSSSTIKYKLTFAGADDILSDNDLAAKITLSPLGIAGTVAVTGAGLTERVVTLTNVTGNGTAVKIAVGSGTASDFAGNQALANSTAKAFVLDNTAPTISVKGPSIIHAKASSSVTYTVTYAGATNVTLAAGDISLSKPDGGGEALSATVAVTGTGNATRTITLSNFTSAGSNARLGITIAAGTAADVIGNLAPAPSASIGTINVDTTAPTFTVSGPSQENAKATSIVTYTVTYSGATKAITLAPKDITINATGVGSAIAASATVKVTPDAGVGCKPGPCTVAPDPMKRFVTLSGFKSTGTLGIAIKTNSASDLAGNFAAAGIDSTTFNVDTGIPTIAVGDPSLPNAKADSTVNYTVYYHGVTGVTLANSHVTLIKTGTANASYEVSGTGDDGTVTRTVTLTGFTGNGTIKIAILKDTATDTAGNLSPAPAATKTFMVDTTVPAAPILPGSKNFNTAFDVKAIKAAAADTSFKELRYAMASGTSVTAPADCSSGTMLVSGGTIAISAATTSVAVIACDKAGNKSAATTATYTLDNVAPTITVSAPSVSDATSATVAVTYTVTYTGADKITLNSAQITRIYTGTAWAGLAPTVTMDTAVPPDPMKRIVTLKSLKGIGTLGISIAAGTASDNAGNLAPAPSPAVSQMFNIASLIGSATPTPTPTPTQTPDTTPPPAPTVTANTSFTTTFNASISVTASDFAKFRYALDSISVLTCATTASAVLTSTSNPLTVPIISGASLGLQAIACDTSGNASPVTVRSYTYVAPTLDTTPPTAPSVTGTTPTNDTTPDWTWTTGGGGNGSYRYKLDNSDLSTGTTATTSTSYTPGTALSATAHTLYVQERDAAGNWSTSGSFAITIDTTAPTAPSVASTTPTNDTTPDWTWTAGGGGNGSYRYKLDSSDFTTGTTATTSTSYTPGTALSATAHTLYVQERDAAGNWSASGSFAITIDTTAPTAPSVTGTTPTNDTTPDWTWTAGGGGNGSYRYKLDSSDFTTGTTATTSTSYTPGTALSAAAHTLYVQERDAAGNWSASGSFAITIDTTLPTAPSVTGTTPTNDTTPDWTWTAGGGGNGSYRYKLDSSDFTTGTTATTSTSYTPGTGLSAAAHTLYVQERDAAGNWSASGSFAITIDTTAPTAPSVTGTTPTNNTTPTWTWTAGGGGNGSYRYKLDSSDLTTGTTATTSTTYTPGTALSAAAHTLYVQERDAAGNWSASGSFAITIDTTAPSAPSVTANQSFTTTFDASISVTASDFAKFRYALDSISVLTCATTASAVLTSTSNPVTVSITSGANWVLQAIACDTAGNASSVTTRSYTYVAPTPTPTPTPAADTTPPAAPVITSIASLTVSPATTSNLKPPVVGTAEANATLNLYRTVSGTASLLATVTVNSIGNWSWTSGTNLSVGTYNITAKATDAASNQSVASATFVLIIQANACADDPIPAAPVITSIGGDMTSPAITNVQKPAVAGTSEAGALVTVYKTIKIDGVSATTTLGTTTASNSGAWTYTPASNFTEGTYDITARITNTSGVNGFEGTPFKLIIDTTAPGKAPTLSPGTQSFSSNFITYLSDYETSDLLEYRYALDTVSTLNCTTTASSIQVSFENTTYINIYTTAATTYLRAISCDKAGNASPVASATYTRSGSAPAADTTPPAVPTITSINSTSGNTFTLYSDLDVYTGVGAYNNFSIQGTSESGSWITVYADSKKVSSFTAWGDWTINPQMLPVGDYAITATATDSSGNESAHSASKTVKVIGLAAPCGGRGMNAYFYMPGLENGDPVMGLGSGQLLNGSGTITLNPYVGVSAAGGSGFAGIGVYLKIQNEDGVDKVYGHVGSWDDSLDWTGTTGWTRATPSESTSVMKRFEIPYSNVANTATTPTSYLNGPALFHVFCPREKDDLPHNITSLQGRFLQPNCTEPRFQGEAAACGLTNVPASFSLKQTYLVPSDGYNNSFQSSDLPVYPSSGRFAASEITGVCSVRNNQYDRNDPSADNYSFARDIWNFSYASVPTFGLSWSPAGWDCYSGLWNKMLGAYYPYSNPSIGSNQVDWRKPVSFWVDSGVNPGFYWHASYVMVGNKQQPDATPWWWFNGGARVPVSELTTFEVDFKPGFDVLPDCSCSLSESTISECRDANGNIRPTLAFKRSTYYYYGSRQGVACTGYEDDYSNGGMCGGSSSSSSSSSSGGMDMGSSSSSSSSGGMDMGSSSSSSSSGGMDMGSSSSSSSSGGSSCYYDYMSGMYYCY